MSYFDADAVLLKLLRGALTGLSGYGYWLWAVMLLVSGLFCCCTGAQSRRLGAVRPADPSAGGSLPHLLLAKPIESASLSPYGRGPALSPAAVCSAVARWEQGVYQRGCVCHSGGCGAGGLCVCHAAHPPLPGGPKGRDRRTAGSGGRKRTGTPGVCAAPARRKAGLRRKAQIDIPLDEEALPSRRKSPLQAEKKSFLLPPPDAHAGRGAAAPRWNHGRTPPKLPP